jgi:DNA-directed RNA polymerase subunit RPC12/RpoP
MKQPAQHDNITAPKCLRCQGSMTISRIVPGEPGRETRTYRCPSCGEELSQTASTGDRSS